LKAGHEQEKEGLAFLAYQQKNGVNYRQSLTEQSEPKAKELVQVYTSPDMPGEVQVIQFANSKPTE